MRASDAIWKIIERFRRDAHGNFGMTLAVLAPMLMLAAGYGLNITQMVMTRSNLLSALDSAVTSTARDLTTGAISEEEARSVVEAFLFANGERGFADADRITLDSLVVDRQRGTVTAQASVVIDMAFPVFGIADQQKITQQSASLYSDKNIEIAMMLDVTGSMRGEKIRDLRNAATNAVEMLLHGQDPRDPRVRVALVPYADSVNVGRLAEHAVFVEKENGRDLPPPTHWSRRKQEAATGRDRDNCATERKMPDLTTDFSDDGPFTKRKDRNGDTYLAKVNRDDRLGLDDRGRRRENACPTAKIATLSADADMLIDAIDDFRASGNTAGAVGVQWTYYMLSSKWRDVIRSAGMGDGPADSNPDEVAKIAILMTDGVFNTAFVGEGRNMGDMSRNNAEGLCDAMKEDGIEIFTIGFDLDGMEQAKAVLKNCSSPDTSSIRHYYEASTGEELNQAYKEIIRNTERLHLTM